MQLTFFINLLKDFLHERDDINLMFYSLKQERDVNVK